MSIYVRTHMQRHALAFYRVSSTPSTKYGSQPLLSSAHCSLTISDPSHHQPPRQGHSTFHALLPPAITVHGGTEYATTAIVGMEVQLPREGIVHNVAARAPTMCDWYDTRVCRSHALRCTAGLVACQCFVSLRLSNCALGFAFCAGPSARPYFIVPSTLDPTTTGSALVRLDRTCMSRFTLAAHQPDCIARASPFVSGGSRSSMSGS